MHWLAGNSHKLDKYSWLVCLMDLAADTLENAMEAIQNDVTQLLDQQYAMGIYQDIINKLLPLSEYLSRMYDVKSMGLICGGRKTAPPVALSSELFSSTSDANKNSSVLTANLAVVAATFILTKLCDKKKATASYLSSLD
eukprot:7171316-Ditylum_brightwellii.AAC.1